MSQKDATLYSVHLVKYNNQGKPYLCPCVPSTTTDTEITIPKKHFPYPGKNGYYRPSISAKVDGSWQVVGSKYKPYPKYFVEGPVWTGPHSETLDFAINCLGKGGAFTLVGALGMVSTVWIPGVSLTWASVASGATAAGVTALSGCLLKIDNGST